MAGSVPAAPGESGGLTANQVQLLANVAAGIGQASGLPALVAWLAQGLGWLVSFDQLALSMRGADGRTWALLRPRLATSGEPGWMELTEPDGPLEEAVRLDRPVRIDRPGSHLSPPGGAANPIVELSTFPSALCLPIHGADGPLGAFGIFSARGGAYAAVDLHVLQVVAVLVEASVRKLVLTDELARAEAEVSRVEKLRSQLTQLIALDLKAPLKGLDGGLEFLQTAVLAPDAHDARHVVDELRLASSSMGEMVANLLDLAKFEEGEVTVRRETVPLEPWLKGRVAQKAVSARVGDVRLFARCVPERAQATLDPALMGRVIDVLLQNAIRYAPKKGQVAVVARVDAGQLTIAVGDTGPEVPPEQRERMFSKHGQLAADHADPLARPGLGLGLYFCKLAVDLHGGRIGIDKLPGAGPLFRIELPDA